MFRESPLQCAPSMKRSLVLWVVALVTSAPARNAVAAVSVFPGDGCPAGDAIEANLERLGALIPLTQLGGAEVRVQEPSLHVFFHDQRGESLGVRVVTASSDCGTRAALAAAVIAAFVGDWVQTKLADAAPPPAVPPPANTRTAAAPPATRQPEPGGKAEATAQPTSPTRPPWQAELGPMIFGIHDGDVGGFGLGVRADLNRGAWMATVLVEGTFDREQPLGSGQGAYRFQRAGLGFGIRQHSRVFWDAALVPMIERLLLRGKNLVTEDDATDWDFVLAGHTRLGWNGRLLRPFLFVGASYRIPSQRMTLTGVDVNVPLSSFNVEAGLGISLRISP
jgi:hypothetical protein